MVAMPTASLVPRAPVSTHYVHTLITADNWLLAATQERLLKTKWPRGLRTWPPSQAVATERTPLPNDPRFGEDREEVRPLVSSPGC